MAQAALDEIGDQGPVSRLIESRSDDELARLMTNLGGHDLPSLLDAFEAARAHERPVCFLCYTIKGFGLPLQGHKDNHAGLLTPAQMERWRDAMQVRPGHEWDRFEGLEVPAGEMQTFIEAIPFVRSGPRRLSAPAVPVPEVLPFPAAPAMSTQQGFGLILNELARSAAPLADRVVTTSPDVTVSTNLGGWVNRRKLFSREEMADVFKREKSPRRSRGSSRRAASTSNSGSRR
jgi:pyruvate dehydrogenase E1 component